MEDGSEVFDELFAALFFHEGDDLCFLLCRVVVKVV